jgi:RNA polymerase sigma factor (sigma-70 family)
MESYTNQAFTSQGLCDEAIWSTFKTGDKHAFGILYHRYFKIMYQYGIRIADDQDFVKDCIHDLFVEIWKSRESLSQPNSVKGYLLSAIQRKIIRQLNRLRSRQQELSLMSLPTVVSCHEENIIEYQTDLEQQHSVTKAMKSLTKRQQEAITLKFYGNLCYKEIATIMCISVDSTYNLISKAVDVLQSELTKLSGQKV